jgi:hypothetical protein
LGSAVDERAEAYRRRNDGKDEKEQKPLEHDVTSLSIRRFRALRRALRSLELGRRQAG